MSDQMTNLIYNGDMSKGTECWTGSGLSVSNGILTVQGSLSHSQFIPVSSNRRYRLSYDMKVNNKVNGTFYTALYPYDNTKTSINIATTNLYNSNCNTTLATELKNGDTTATLTNGASWGTTLTYQRIGICNKLAWGYGRCTVSQPYTTRNGNVITLKNPWSNGTIAAGTKVSLYRDGSTYFYPNSITFTNLPEDWTHYSIEFNGGNNIRYSCQYVKFGTLGAQNNYSFKNIRLECISDLQYCNDLNPYDIDLSKQGVLTGFLFKENGEKIRYVKDMITGSTANSNNHWCEFQVFNNVNENIAWGRDVTLNTVNSNSVITDGIVNSSYLSGNSTTYLTFDIGYIEEVSKIKIWHYYPDGRTYHNNIVQVSLDGENWRTIYQGEKKETVEGNEIILHPIAQFTKDGIVCANNIYEF